MSRGILICGVHGVVTSEIDESEAEMCRRRHRGAGCAFDLKWAPSTQTPEQAAEAEARAIAVGELVRQYGISEAEATERLEAALEVPPTPRRSWRCRIGRHAYGDRVTIAEAGTGVVLSKVHGPLATPPFRVVGMTCEKCPTVKIDVIAGAS